MGLVLPRLRTARVAVIAAALAAGACSSEPDFDLIIRGGTVYDGTGETAGVKRADVGIKADRITAIGDLTELRAPVVVDATGKAVSPGVIEVLATESDVRQGVTTKLLSPASLPLNEYFARLEATGTTVNVGAMVPLSLARAAGDQTAFIDTGLRDGAFGVLDDVNAGVPELVAAATIAGRYDGMMMLNVESPAAMDDASLMAIGQQAHRIVINGWSRLPSNEALSELIRRITRAGQQNVSVFGALGAAPPSTDGSSGVTREALKYGSMLVGARTVDVSAALELREAVRRGSSLPASIFQLPQRGIIRENYFADLVISDQRAIDYVIVNGVVVLTPQGVTGARPGSRLVHRTTPR